MTYRQDRKSLTDVVKHQHTFWSSRFLDTVGDGSGSIDAAVNGSGTPVDFSYICPAGRICYVNMLIVGVVTDGKINSGEYGNVTALTNGVTAWFKEKEGDPLINRTIQLPVKLTTDWQMYSHDLKISNFGVGNETLTVKHDFRTAGAPLIMLPGGQYTIRIADDLSDLVNHYFRLDVACRIV